MTYWEPCRHQTCGAHWPKPSPRVLRAKAGTKSGKRASRLLAATLAGDIAERNREISGLQDMAKSADQQDSYFYNSVLQQLGQATLAMSDNPDDILKSLGYQLAYGNGQGVEPLQVPNLVSAIGAGKSRSFFAPGAGRARMWHCNSTHPTKLPASRKSWHWN